ncbi:MAG: membrane protein insertase YidC, partial [Nitrospirae bacterium]|nr:membrane protein insertase YidC [Nitrospirota bacterium]
MEKRTLLAIIISVAILIVYQYFFVPATPPVTNQGAVKPAVKEEERKAPAPVLLPKADVAAAEKDVTIENELYTAVLSSRGGTIKSISLKKYKDKNGNPIALKGEDVLPPLSIGTDEEFQFSKANFSVRGKDIKLSPSVSQADLVFEYSADGRSIRRTYTFYNDKYAIDLKDEVNGLDSYWITPGKDFGLYEKDSSMHFGPVVLKDADRMEFTGSKLKEAKSFKEGVKWVAQEDKYFFSSIVPKGQIEETKVWSKDNDALVAMKLKGGTNNYLLYTGPKENDRLKQHNVGLEYIIDFGFFSVIARPLFWVLKLFYKISHNYGIAIIILTILVRIPFIPLVNKGQKSMRKLQDIQPRMAEIKEKYKNDPQRLQRETMELYKKYKVNPVGG